VAGAEQQVLRLGAARVVDGESGDANAQAVGPREACVGEGEFEGSEVGQAPVLGAPAPRPLPVDEDGASVGDQDVASMQIAMGPAQRVKTGDEVAQGREQLAPGAGIAAQCCEQGTALHEARDEQRPAPGQGRARQGLGHCELLPVEGEQCSPLPLGGRLPQGRLEQLEEPSARRPAGG